MFRIRGNPPLASQLPDVSARHLNSYEAFLITGEQPTLWVGKRISEARADYCKVVVEKLGIDELNPVLEGSEPVDFWLSIGAKTDYAYLDMPVDFEPMLFEFRSQGGF